MRGARTVLLVVSLGLPTVAAWWYFVRPTEHLPLIYGTAKAIQALLPLLGWLVLGMRRRSPWRASPSIALRGLVTGVLLSAPMLVLYYGGLDEVGWLGAAREAIVRRLESFGATSLVGFLLIAAGLSLLHSLFEEYYWRWFVFDALENRIPLNAALVVSGLAFASHHVIVIDRLLGGRILLAILFAVGVAVAGVVWAWQRHRDGSLLSPWLSHALVDATVFWLGWEVAGGSGLGSS